MLYRPIEDIDTDYALLAYKTGPLASLKFMQLCFPYMKENHWGRIINTASAAGYDGSAGFGTGMAKGSDPRDHPHRRQRMGTIRDYIQRLPADHCNGEFPYYSASRAESAGRKITAAPHRDDGRRLRTDHRLLSFRGFRLFQRSELHARRRSAHALLIRF